MINLRLSINRVNKVITPDTRIELLVCPLTADQENQITFANRNAQNEYFESLPSDKDGQCSYQRKDGYIRYTGNVDNLQRFNYVRYQNKLYSNKWFYAFIERMEYVGEYITHIYIKTDVYQTWMFDFELEPSFVEREHVDNDGFGLHTIPEGLEYGPYVVNEFIPADWADPYTCLYCLQVTDFPSSARPTNAPLQIYNNMPSGCFYLVFRNGDIGEMNKWITAYAADTKADAILSIFPVPSALASPEEGLENIYKLENSISNKTYVWAASSGVAGIPIRLTSVTIPYSSSSPIDGYRPKNNKLYSYPYCYFYFNSFTGTTVEYDYNQFYGPIQFNIYGSITTGCEFKMIPNNYNNKGRDASYGYGVALSAMPQGSWNNDAYLNWRALNMDALSIQTSATVANAAVSGIGNLFSLNFAGAASAGINAAAAIASAENQITVASKMPDQARGDTAVQSLNWSMGHADGGFYCMTIKAEYAKIIDQYFTMYGYKVNELKVPNLRSRRYYNYIKTIGVNLTGEAPQSDLLELKQIFDRGITFWHDPSKFLNYNVDNAII